MTSSRIKLDYGSAIRSGFEYLLENHADVFVLGQGLWSPWYVGNTMTRLEVQFGKDRVIDTPVSEQATTGAAIGAAVAGMRPIVVHPRMDFMVLAVDQIVGQAAKWSSMFAGKLRVPLVIRGIINRGGEQGAQHSQALHSWFAHIPGLRVVMPATVADARDLLVSAVLCDDPVLYIDDRWLYEQTALVDAEPDVESIYQGPAILRSGGDLTIVAAGYSVLLAQQAADMAAGMGIEVEVIDLRVANPLDFANVHQSVLKTGRLLAIDGGWTACGLAGETIARVAESLEPGVWRASPQRVTIQDAPAPTSRPLEAAYYPTAESVLERIVATTTGTD